MNSTDSSVSAFLFFQSQLRSLFFFHNKKLLWRGSLLLLCSAAATASGVLMSPYGAGDPGRGGDTSKASPVLRVLASVVGGKVAAVQARTPELESDGDEEESLAR